MFEDKYFLDLQGLAEYDKLIKAYIDARNGDQEQDLATLEAELVKALALIENNTKSIETLNGDKDTEGSVLNAVDTAINGVLGGASEAFDTLKEIETWIEEDGERAAELVNRIGEDEDRIAANEADIVDIKNAALNMKDYIDTQDKSVYDSIQSISDPYIAALFYTPVTLKEGDSISSVLQNLANDEKLVLSPDDVIEGTIQVYPGNVIEANGATFTGQVKVPHGAIIMNAVFAGGVVTEEVPD